MMSQVIGDQKQPLTVLTDDTEWMAGEILFFPRVLDLSKSPSKVI